MTDPPRVPRLPSPLHAALALPLLRSAVREAAAHDAALTRLNATIQGATPMPTTPRWSPAVPTSTALSTDQGARVQAIRAAREVLEGLVSTGPLSARERSAPALPDLLGVADWIMRGTPDQEDATTVTIHHRTGVNEFTGCGLYAPSIANYTATPADVTCPRCLPVIQLPGD